MLIPIQWPTRLVPRVFDAGYFHLADRDFGSIHLLHEHVLHIYNYHARLRLAHQEFEIHPSDFTFTPAGVPASYHLPGPGHHWAFRFLPPEDDLPDSPVVSLPLHGRLGHEAPSVLSQITQFISLLTQAGASMYTQSVAEAGLLHVMLNLALPNTLSTSTPSATSARIAPAYDAAEQLRRYTAQDISIPKVARTIGIGQKSLAKMFRELFGMTMPHYLLVLRVNKAQHLLTITDLPVGTIAKQVGMPDITHFSRQFKLINGVNPTTYRCQVRTRYQPETIKRDSSDFPWSKKGDTGQ